MLISIFMNITDVNIESIIPYNNNPRVNEEAVEVVKKSLQEFGFQQPLVLDKKSTIIVGHTRYTAAKQLGLQKVPCVIAKDLDEEKIKAYRIMDNKSAEFASWNYGLLTKEITDLLDADYNLDFTGFSEEELIDLGIDLNDEFVDITDENLDEIPEIGTKNITSEKDLWQLGKHRLYCGDSQNKNDYVTLTNNEKINMVLTDPPYGVDYANKNKMLNERFGGERIEHYMEADDVENKDFYEFANKFIKNIELTPYNTIYIWISGANVHNLRQAMIDNDIYCASHLIWVKNNHVLTRQDYAAKTEICLYGWKNKHKFYGGFSTDVLEFDRPLSNKLHPTMKPLNLIEKLLLDGSKFQHKVLDLFGGSGTTLIACEKNKRICYVMEKDPLYCDVIIKRWQDMTGKDAVLKATGHTFNEICKLQKNTESDQ